MQSGVLAIIVQKAASKLGIDAAASEKLETNIQQVYLRSAAAGHVAWPRSRTSQPTRLETLNLQESLSLLGENS
jgi:hypothetical protein